MKIVLDLKDKLNNFMVEDKEELKKYIDTLITCYEFLYKDTLEDGKRYNAVSNEEHNKFYDILVLFKNYEIKGDNEE